MTELIKKLNIKSIDSIITVRSKRGEHDRIAKRRTYGLSFCIDGQITYEHNGKKFVQDRYHAVILPEGESYMLYRDRSGSFPLINFTCFEPICNTHVLIPIDDPDTYIADFERLRRLSVIDGNRMKMFSILYGMFHKLLNPSVAGSLTPAIKHIESNLGDPELNNPTLAHKCNLSETHFRKLFLSRFGITPRQFIIDARINKAKQLLTEGSLKIGTVAEICGFSSQYHFSRCFKAHIGQTPTEYMLKNRSRDI